MGGATNCPETPRQKMIGMMYLVLTAMLALNVSAAILNGYAKVDESLHATIETMQEGNADTYAKFRVAMDQNPEKTEKWYNKAMEVQRVSNEFYNYVQGFKDNMVQLIGGNEGKVNAKVGDIKKPDDTNVPQQYGIEEGNAKVLKEKIHAYRLFLEGITGNVEPLRSELEATFITPKGINTSKDSITWEESIFHEMPICAALTVLSKIQNDIRHCEGKVVGHLLQMTDAGDLRVNKFSAHIIPSAKNVMKGQKYSAQLLFAAIDSTQALEYYVNGQKLNSNGVYEVIANNVGPQKIKGQIGYKDPQGVMQYLPFEDEYMVTEPAATISNVELNVMYRGYNNPFSISVPGISSHLLQVKCAHATVTEQDNGLWIIKPTNNSPDRLTIEVFTEIDGRVMLMGAQDYRIRQLPKPDAFFEINGVPTDNEWITRANLINPKNKIVASYGADEMIQAKFDIVSFQIKLPTGAVFTIQGDKLNDKAIAEIRKQKPGSMITLRLIKAKGPDGKEQTLRQLAFELK